MASGDGAGASAAFAEARRIAPDNLSYALHRVAACACAGTLEAELAWLDAAGASDPLDFASAVARGAALEALGRLDEAADALEVAAILDPASAVAASMRACVLVAANRLQEADAALALAIALDPDSALLVNNRAAVLMRLHRPAEARTLLLDLLARHEPEPGVLCNLATATLSCGRQEEAEAIAQDAIRLAPDQVLPRRTLCNTRIYGETADGASVLAALRACSDRLPRDAGPPFANSPDPGRRLRLGLLSGTMRTHPVGWFTVAAFEALDPAAFEIVGLSQMRSDDPIARRFRARASDWHDIARLDDPGLRTLARDAGIDVLIDLGGYGDLGRMPACALRLAPVQVKWVGMQNHSTGLPEMDWFLTDAWETPPGYDRLYTERLLRLPDGYVCYAPPPHAPDVGPLPALANGHVTFGCFNNIAKITPRVIRTWARILRRVPDARLVLKAHQFSDPGTAQAMLEAFGNEGVAPGRIACRGASGHRVLLGEYNDVDFVLDPFPYSGGLTTCEALWMGVPTLTCPGETFASRHSASHLCNVGLSDWVVSSLDEYEGQAVARAADPGALAALRGSLRARVQASPLCDAPRFGRHLGKALRHAWAEWCRGRASA